MAEELDKSVLQVLVELVDQVSEPLNQIHERFENFENEIWSLGAAWSSAFLGYELFEHLIEPASDFQEAQVRLALATHASTKELAEFKEQASELAAEYPSSIEQITEAQTELYKTFRDRETVTKMTELSAKLGLVLGTDATKGAIILASAYENLGDQTKNPVEETTYLANKLSLLTTMFPLSGGGAARMAIDLARVGASARTYGINVNQLFAVLGELNRLHVGGQRGAGMFAQQLIYSLAEVDSHGIPTMQKYGLQIVRTTDGHLNLIETLRHLSQLNPKALAAIEAHFPGQAQAISQLVTHFKDLDSAYHEFVHSSGNVDEAAKQLNNTWAVQSVRLKDAWNDFLDVFGTLALPTLTKLLVILRDIITTMEHWANTHPKLAKTIALFVGIAAAAVTVIAVLGAIGATIGFVSAGLEVLAPLVELVTSTFEILSLVMELTPLGWVITGMAAIVFLSYEIYKHWGDIKETVLDVVHAISSLGWAKSTIEFVKGVVNSNSGMGGIASGVSNIVMAAPVAPTTGDTHLHYMEGAQITVQGGNTQDTTQAVKQVLENHATDLDSMLRERSRQQNRVSFTDQAAFAH